MATVALIYNRRNKLSIKGLGSIDYRVTIDRKPTFISTGIKVSPNNWDKNKSEVKKINSNWFEYNTLLEKNVSLINRYFIESDLERTVPDVNQIKELLGKKVQKRNDLFFAFCRDEVSRRNDIANDTSNRHLAKLNYLEEWTGGELEFRKVNLRFIEDLELYLTKQNLVKNTRAKYHAVLKTYIRRAINKKLMKYEENPYNAFKIRKEEAHRERLTEMELITIENLIIKDNIHLEVIKDKFLFSCYSGLRFSDYQNIDKSNFNFVSEKEVYLTFKMLKVGTSINRMPLHRLFKGKAIDIIRKYITNEYSTGKLFPTHSEGYYNRSLKKIALLAKITKTVTSHVGRHTFGSLLAEKTNDPMLIKTLMGHKHIETSMIYIKLSNKGVEDKLSQIDW